MIKNKQIAELTNIFESDFVLQLDCPVLVRHSAGLLINDRILGFYLKNQIVKKKKEES